MASWTIEYTQEVYRILRKMDKGIAREIYRYLDDIEKLEDPRLRGKGLTANHSGLWRYRVRDMRIICDIQDSQLMVLVIHIGNRETVYTTLT